MDTYSLLREFADSWMLLAMTLFFIGVILWAFRPGSGETHRYIAETPLRNDALPLDVRQAQLEHGKAIAPAPSRTPADAEAPEALGRARGA